MIALVSKTAVATLNPPAKHTFQLECSAIFGYSHFHWLTSSADSADNQKNSLGRGSRFYPSCVLYVCGTRGVLAPLALEISPLEVATRIA